MCRLKQTVSSLFVDKKAVIENITNIVAEIIRGSEGSEQLNLEKLEKQMQDLTEKKKNVLDAFFSQNITKDEMRMMNEKYDADILLTADRITAAKKKQSLSYSCSDIKADVRKSVDSIVNCKEQQDSFYGSLLDKMVMYGDDWVEVSLNLLPTKWIYVIESLKDIQKRTGGGKYASCDYSRGVVHCDPSLPISFNIPFASSVGMLNL